MKKSLLALAVLAPLSLGQAFADDGARGSIYRPMEAVTPAVAPEMDAAAGALAVALVGGGIALYKRARRKRQD